MLSLGFLLLADAASEGPAIVLDTCANRCEEGEFYNIRKFSCGCYEGCEEWNNCCEDKKDVCNQNNTQGGAQQAEEKPVDSCANRCEEDEHFDFVKFSCGCYATCEEWGDCCQDRKDVCSQNNTQGGAQDKTAEHVSAIAADSCADRCEEEEHYDFRKFQCGCYGGCEDWNDCCHDKKDVCGHEDAPVLLDVAQGLRGDDDDDDKPRPPIAAASALELSVLLFVALV